MTGRGRETIKIKSRTRSLLCGLPVHSHSHPRVSYVFLMKEEYGRGRRMAWPHATLKHGGNKNVSNLDIFIFETLIFCAGSWLLTDYE